MKLTPMTIKKKSIAASILLCIALAVSTPVLSQSEMMELDCIDSGQHQRPIVLFPHLTHEVFVECKDCHHEKNAYGENVGGKGGYCSDCHTCEALKNPVPLIEAFHLQCKKCHAHTIETSENKNIPQMCGQCHVKKRDS